MGMRIDTFDKVLNASTKDKIIRYTEFKDRFGEDEIDKIISKSRNKKFNVKVNEIHNIYNVETRIDTNLSAIIIPVYMPDMEHTMIKKIDEDEKKEAFFKYRTQGAYSSTRYIEDIFGTTKVTMPDIKNIDIYKIYENEKNVNELFSSRGLLKWLAI